MPSLLVSQAARLCPLLPEGCPHSNVAVVGHFLAFLKDYLTEQLRRTYGGKLLTTHTIKYCFTIPAGWSADAKSALRQYVAAAAGQPLLAAPRCSGAAADARAAAAWILLTPACLKLSSQGRHAGGHHPQQGLPRHGARL
jgi:hypothetical protein